MIQPPLPVTIVTGFLGVGKTTLLSNLLHHAHNRRLAIVVNEFGEVSIDGALLRNHQRGDEVQVQDTANGLLAYGTDASFTPLMAHLHARRDLIDHIVIETSGLAVPTAVMERLQSDLLLAERFALDATLAVVDTPLLLSGQFDASGSDPVAHSIAELFLLQLDSADVVVLNKIDALDKRVLIDAETHIRRLAPGVRFIELAYRAQLDTRLALGLRLHESTSLQHRHSDAHASSLQTSAQLSKRLDGHSHTGIAPHAHGLTTHQHFHEHDPGWQSFMLHCSAPQVEATLLSALAETAQIEPVMRIKGFVYVEGAPQPLLIQGVRGRIGAVRNGWPVREAHGQRTLGEAGPRQHNGDSQLVFIGYHTARNRVAEILSRLTGACWH